MLPAAFFAPLMMSIEDKPNEQDVYVTSDLWETWEGTLRWSLETLDGSVLETGEETVKSCPL